MWLTTEARAQVAETTKAAADAAGVLLQYQVLGAFCVFLIVGLIVAGFVIRSLYNHNQGLHVKVADIFAKAVTAVEASTAALVESRGTSQALADAVEALGKAVGEVSHSNEVHDREVKHGLNNTAFALTGLKEKLDKICEKLQLVRDHVVTPSTGGRRPQ